jgi:hypothetical protein
LSYSCGLGIDYFPPCNGSYVGELLNSTLEFNRSFGRDGGSCKLETPSENATNIGQNGPSNSTSDALSSLASKALNYWYILFASGIAAFV